MPLVATSGGSEANLLGDGQFLRKAASLYHEDGRSQEAIAELLSCSRQTVGKALQKAKDRGFVRTSILPDPREGYLRNLSRDVRRAMGLGDVVLVAGRNFDSLSGDASLDEVVDEIGRAAAGYLDQMLTGTDIASAMRTWLRMTSPGRTTLYTPGIVSPPSCRMRRPFRQKRSGTCMPAPPPREK